MKATNKKAIQTYILFIIVYSSALFFSTIVYGESADNNTNGQKKRDPFVALVSSDGKIKTKDQLFPQEKPKSLSMNLKVNAILWDEKRPLVLINNKVYSEGSEITKGLAVNKILLNSVVLNDNGNIVTLQLRKKVGQ